MGMVHGGYCRYFRRTGTQRVHQAHRTAPLLSLARDRDEDEAALAQLVFCVLVLSRHTFKK